MTTQEIRNEVTAKAYSARAIWPNGLGFTWRGWEYSYGERGWTARRNDWQGRGESPTDAKANAYRIPAE